MSKSQEELNAVVELVRRMHAEGVTRFKMDLDSGAIEVEFAPEFVVSGRGVAVESSEPQKPFDAALCVTCQKKPVGVMMPGACDPCALKAAGTA